MTQEDPFAGQDDPDQTVIRPRPGGQRRAQADGGSSASGRGAAPVSAPDSAPASPVVDAGTNPIVSAASPLLGLAIRLRNRAVHADVEALRHSVIAEVRAFEQRALATGLDRKSLRAARYALCATIDDLVLNTPWGSRSSWPAQGMVSTFHNEVSGGKRFFDILDDLRQDPGRHIEVLDLMFLCLSLGFEGQYRVMPRGGAALEETRDSLYRTLRAQRGDFERELSPHWTGVEVAHRPVRTALPVWVTGVATAFVLALVFLLFSFLLNGRSDQVFAQLGELPPNGPVVITRAAPAPAPQPVIESAQLPRIREFLKPEIDEGLVTTFEDAQSITIRIRNQGMFGSGEADVQRRFLPTLERVGKALRDEPGAVIVAGHSDNVPIRTVRFPSNFHLSLARAEAVRDVIATQMADPGRLTAEGRAANEPIAGNDTAEGRERNRRTEIILVKPAETALSDAPAKG